jgi:YbbR domain-containing protein
MKKKRLHIIIAASLFGVLLWLFVTMSYEYQTVIAIPLIVENVAPDRAIANPFPKTVQLKVRANGWRSAALLLGAEQRCIIDVASLGSYKHTFTLFDVVDRLAIPVGIQPVDMKPESLHFYLETILRKRVPITLNLETNFRAGYGPVGGTQMTPDSVTVSGAASVLKTIDAWPTAPTVLTDIKSPLTADVVLADSASQYVKLSPRTVSLHIDVQQYAEKTFAGLPVATEDVPSNKEVILIPPKIDLIVRGGVQLLSTLGNDNFRATVSYRAIVDDSSGYTEPHVVAPRGVELVTKKPERMQFIIRTKL